MRRFITLALLAPAVCAQVQECCPCGGAAWQPEAVTVTITRTTSKRPETVYVSRASPLSSSRAATVTVERIVTQEAQTVYITKDFLPEPTTVTVLQNVEAPSPTSPSGDEDTNDGANDSPGDSEGGDSNRSHDGGRNGTNNGDNGEDSSNSGDHDGSNSGGDSASDETSDRASSPGSSSDNTDSNGSSSNDSSDNNHNQNGHHNSAPSNSNSSNDNSKGNGNGNESGGGSRNGKSDNSVGSDSDRTLESSQGEADADAHEPVGSINTVVVNVNQAQDAGGQSSPAFMDQVAPLTRTVTRDNVPHTTDRVEAAWLAVTAAPGPAQTESARRIVTTRTLTFADGHVDVEVVVDIDATKHIYFDDAAAQLRNKTCSEAETLTSLATAYRTVYVAVPSHSALGNVTSETKNIRVQAMGNITIDGHVEATWQVQNETSRELRPRGPKKLRW